MRTFLGIDYGSARVGVASGNDLVRLASPVATVKPEELVALVKREAPSLLVVGLPRSLDGAETAQTLAVRRYTDDVLSGTGLEIVFQDEAGSSGVAEDRLREAGKPYLRSDIDAEAAAVILQDYLDTL